MTCIKKGYNNRRKIDVKDLPFDFTVSYSDPKAISQGNQAGKTTMKFDKKTGEKIVSTEFVGTREVENPTSMYFVFYMSSNKDQELHACPVDSIYNFKKKIKHSVLSIEEAEERWENRHKILDLDAFMSGRNKNLVSKIFSHQKYQSKIDK